METQIDIRQLMNYIYTLYRVTDCIAWYTSRDPGSSTFQQQLTKGVHKQRHEVLL